MNKSLLMIKIYRKETIAVVVVVVVVVPLPFGGSFGKVIVV
jgi:hypothetical protein